MRVFVPSMRSSPAVRPTPDTPQQEAAWRERPTPLQVDASDWTVTDLTCSHEVLLPSRQTRKLSFPAGALNLVARKSKQLPTSSDSRQKQQKLQKNDCDYCSYNRQRDHHEGQSAPPLLLQEKRCNRLIASAVAAIGCVARDRIMPTMPTFPQGLCVHLLPVAAKGRVSTGARLRRTPPCTAPEPRSIETADRGSGAASNCLVAQICA